MDLELNSDLPTNPLTQFTIAQDIFVSNIVTFPLVNPVPVASSAIVSSLSPSTVKAGSGTFTLTVNGSGFTPNSKVVWATPRQSTTLVSANQLTATIDASLVAAVGDSDRDGQHRRSPVDRLEPLRSRLRILLSSTSRILAGQRVRGEGLLQIERRPARGSSSSMVSPA